ncbi:sugar phosphate isomerase/epimerase family protein [Pedobacter cryophilus]|uniref:Sugar phosphate isomerase/epimerase n=1 Tax=Pedobacter cryophilus TaxID=2571271 RepID=A0A4U1C503_9SPHI|nr:sugar phosphate isomerase/epimerase [Pedobacter cryophilus]TKC00483.1 sugar phosphate isomerase/epimerase [Pedobacter cryophilus]
MNNSRRNFIKQTGLAAASITLLPYLGCAETAKIKKFGIQLYSLRNEITSGIEKVIGEVAKAGYNYVEGYGYSEKTGFFGLKPQAYKDLLDKNNLTTPSAHYDFGDWEKSQDDSILKSYIDAAKILDQKYIVVPYTNPDIFKDETACRAYIAKLNRASKIVKDAGLKLAYHNHDLEFFDLKGKTGFSILLEESDPELLDLELDLYWVMRAKQDPIQLFKDHPGRFTMWHVKDMSKTNNLKNTEVGNGTIDFTTIFKNAKLSGLKYPFVEQENFEIDPYQSITKSASYLSKLIK